MKILVPVTRSCEDKIKSPYDAVVAIRAVYETCPCHGAGLYFMVPVDHGGAM